VFQLEYFVPDLSAQGSFQDNGVLATTVAHEFVVACRTRSGWVRDLHELVVVFGRRRQKFPTNSVVEIDRETRVAPLHGGGCRRSGQRSEARRGAAITFDTALLLECGANIESTDIPKTLAME